MEKRPFELPPAIVDGTIRPKQRAGGANPQQLGVQSSKCPSCHVRTSTSSPTCEKELEVGAGPPPGVKNHELCRNCFIKSETWGCIQSRWHLGGLPGVPDGLDTVPDCYRYPPPVGPPPVVPPRPSQNRASHRDRFRQALDRIQSTGTLEFHGWAPPATATFSQATPTKTPTEAELEEAERR